MSRRRRLIDVAAACAVVALATLATPRPAAAAANLLWPSGSGMTAPAGIATTPAGDVWVADEIRGICRLAPGAGGGVVHSAFCGAGELDHFGPAKPTGLAFDAATSSFYASDGVSNAGAIWRLHYDAATRTIDDASRLVLLARDRVAGMTLGTATAGGGASELFFVTKDSTAVMRLPLPAGPGRAPTTIGFAQSAHPGGIAYLDGVVYLAEGSGVTSLALGAEGDGIADAVPALGTPAVTALAADPASHRLYVGTSETDLRDQIGVLDASDGTVETYEPGFTGVTALAVQPGGDLLAADDPRASSGAIDNQGHGRLWRVPMHPLGRPSVRITSGPPAVGAALRASFAYSSRAVAWFQCRLGDVVWATCPGKGSGSMNYDGLPEGVHRFTVRAVDGDQGVPATRTFVIDRTAPKVRVATPAGILVAGGPAPTVNISADEDYVVFSCSVDGGPFGPCRPGDPLPGLGAGQHWLRVIAVDLAGNVSDAREARAAVSFRMREPARPIPPPVRPLPPSTPVVQPQPQLRPLHLTPANITRRAAARRWRPLRLALQAPPNAARARIVVLNRRRTVVTRDVRLRPGRVNRIAIALSAKERRRMRRGLYLVTAILGGTRGAVGSAQAEELRVARRP